MRRVSTTRARRCSVVFLVCLLVPLTFAPEWGWAAPTTLGLLLLSVAALVSFVIVERRVKAPVLDLDLLVHNRLFAAANLAALLNYMALYAISMLTAIYPRSRAGPVGVGHRLAHAQPAASCRPCSVPSAAA